MPPQAENKFSSPGTLRLHFWLLAGVLLTADLVMAESNEQQNPPSATSSSLLDSEWRLISDQVMGGVSSGQLLRERVSGRDSLCLRGTVSTDNNGGFIQMAVDLAEKDIRGVTAYDGLKLWVHGNNEQYNVHLRTTDLWLPWQSYRTSFQAGQDWQQITLPFASFAGYKTRRPLDLGKLKRIGLVAIGRDFEAELCVSEIRFYRD